MRCDLTYEELMRFATGETSAERAGAIGRHVAECAACGPRLEAIRQADEAVRELCRTSPPPGALLEVRRALLREVRGGPATEIMTLDEAAAFLRVSADELAQVLDELPAFELAGQVRVRRTKLVEWIEGRERSFRKASIESWVAQGLSDAAKEDVA